MASELSEFYAGKRILVTGGSGFVGSHLVRRLEELGASTFVVRSIKFDLRKTEDSMAAFRVARTKFNGIDAVFHLAATVSGIGATSSRPATHFYDNAMMGMNVIHAAAFNRVSSLVCVGSVCAYPKLTPMPMIEDNLWNGYPEETNAPYGVAKRMLHSMLTAYRQQYGLRSVYLLMANLFGEGDDFDPETSHVIPALILKCLEAKANGNAGIAVWGSGQASRDFVYVQDAVSGLLLAGKRQDFLHPINIGSGNEITIAGLADQVMKACDFQGGVYFDRSRPDGQPRRSLRTWLAKEVLGWEASTSLYDGLCATVNWYIGQGKKKVKERASR